MAVLAAAGSFADAHHAFSPVYDEARTMTVEGVVDEFRLVNPHAMMRLRVTDGEGRAVIWTVEFAGLLSLTRRGWTADTLKPGMHITVSGNPTHTGSSGLFFRRIVLADGTELLAPGAENVETIEEERRQRALQRQQQN
jgi:hypothetical protein